MHGTRTRRGDGAPGTTRAVVLACVACVEDFDAVTVVQLSCPVDGKAAVPSDPMTPLNLDPFEGIQPGAVMGNAFKDSEVDQNERSATAFAKLADPWHWALHGRVW